MHQACTGCTYASRIENLISHQGNRFNFVIGLIIKLREKLLSSKLIIRRDIEADKILASCVTVVVVCSKQTLYQLTTQNS